MASGDEVKYTLQDKLDEFLAESISTYVIISKLSTFANDLRVPRREMERIMAPNVFQQDQRVKEVSRSLHGQVYPDILAQDFFIFVQFSGTSCQLPLAKYVFCSVADPNKDTLHRVSQFSSFSRNF